MSDHENPQASQNPQSSSSFLQGFKRLITMIIPPFDPDQKGAPFRTIPLRLLLPNMITLLSLAAGLTAIRQTIEGNIGNAMIAIAFAAVLDGLDGRIARMMKGTSRFGAELDSLCDFVSFGCAPAMILYFWALNSLNTFGWIIALIFTFAMALRLARFNAMLDSDLRPEWQKAYFMGVPAPAGAMLALLPVNLALAGVPLFTGHSLVVAIYLFIISILTVSRLPTLSMKSMTGPVPRHIVLPLLAGILLFGTLLSSHTFGTLALLAGLYLATIPVTIRSYMKKLHMQIPTPSAPATTSDAAENG